MENPAVQQYKRSLKTHLRGRKQRKNALADFEKLLPVFLEETPSPCYDDLVNAFGPPEEMAAELQTKFPYQPMTPKQKLLLALVIVCAAACIAAAWYIITKEEPEEGILYTNFLQFSDDDMSKLYAALWDEFNPRDSSWPQSKEFPSYVLEAHNENVVPAQILIRYREDIDPHIFIIPPGETYVFVVNNALPGEHTISFDAPDTTYVGYVQVYVCEEPFFLPTP